MKRSRLVAPIAAAALAVMLGSCMALPAGLPNPLGGLRARTDAEISSAVGLTGMGRKMMFNVIYSQVFFIGGFGAYYYDLEETQGTIWRVESRGEDGSIDVIEAERALLKSLPNGERWWFLAWRADGEAWEFEALMDKELNAKKIRYYNADVRRVEEAKFDPPSAKADPQAETTPPEAAPTAALGAADFKNYVKGRETVRVGTASYQTERIEWSFFDEEEKVTYRYSWWVDPKAPGGLVKFEWAKSGSKESLRGELVSVKKGYTTKFSSF